MGDSAFLKEPGWLQEILSDSFRRYLFLGLNTSVGNRYARHCRIVGGAISIVLGGVMVIQPELLR